MAAKGSFTLWRGTAQRLEFSVTDANGNAVDVSGWTAIFTMRPAPAAADPPSLQVSASIASAPGGVLAVALTKAGTLLLTAGAYVYTLERTNAGSEDVVAEGTVRVRLDIVNAPS